MSENNIKGIVLSNMYLIVYIAMKNNTLIGLFQFCNSIDIDAR